MFVGTPSIIIKVLRGAHIFRRVIIQILFPPGRPLSDRQECLSTLPVRRFRHLYCTVKRPLSQRIRETRVR